MSYKTGSRIACLTGITTLAVVAVLIVCSLGICPVKANTIIGVERAYAANSESFDGMADESTVTAQSGGKKAHAAYKKKLKSLCKKNGIQSIRYKFVDINRDGTDEMIVGWFPEVYMFKGGKAKRVNQVMTGSSNYKISKKAKVFCLIEPDHCGSATYDYYKWNGKKFAHVATMYTPDENDTYLMNDPYYWVKGKGSVSKKKASKYVKKILKGSKLSKVSYNTFTL